MTSTVARQPAADRSWRLPLILVAVGLGAARVPAAVPSANQYTYFLHGFASLGVGWLREDWLAQTPDLFPAVTAIIVATMKYLPVASFYVYYCALVGVYGCALFGIAARACGETLTGLSPLILAAALLVLHWGVPIQLVSGAAVPLAIATDGVAAQTLTGFLFQPSLFGVLILAGLWALLAGRTLLGWLLICSTPLLHVNYLPAAGLFAGTWLAVSRRSRTPIASAALAVVGAVLLGLAAWLAWRTFHPTSPDLLARAAEIQVEYRIPHHAKISEWFGPSVVIQIGLVLGGLWVMRRSPLAPVVAVATTATVALSLWQLFSGSKPLAITGPWRTSVFLVPLSTAVIVAWVAAVAGRRWPVAGLPAVRARFALVVVSLAVAASGALLSARQARQHASSERQLFAFVQQTRHSRDVYVVPVDLEGFRIETGVPVLVDVKSTPGRDFEIVEWYERLQAALRVYDSARRANACDAMDDLAGRYRVTHFVWRGSGAPSCPRLVPIYTDNVYAVFRIR